MGQSEACKQRLRWFASFRLMWYNAKREPTASWGGDRLRLQEIVSRRGEEGAAAPLVRLVYFASLGDDTEQVGFFVP